MSTVQTDYAGIIVQSWTDIDNGVMTHMENIVNQTESLSQGIVGIISDMTKSIEKMMVDMLYKQYIMKPLGNWFSNIIGGMTGGGGAATMGYVNTNFSTMPSTAFAHADGGVASGWSLVGENGPELANFTNPARIYTAGQTQQMMSGSGGNVTLTFAPNITVKSANKEDTASMVETIKQNWAVFRGEFINDLRNNSAVRSAAKGAAL
jgi:phage-related minor tail protein